jgi:hypothetical protein
MRHTLGITVLGLFMLTLPGIAQEQEEEKPAPSYSAGDRLLIETLQKSLESANTACQAQLEVQTYQELSQKFVAYVESTYPGYTVGQNFRLVPTAIVSQSQDDIER